MTWRLVRREENRDCKQQNVSEGFWREVVNRELAAPEVFRRDYHGEAASQSQLKKQNKTLTLSFLMCSSCHCLSQGNTLPVATPQLDKLPSAPMSVAAPTPMSRLGFLAASQNHVTLTGGVKILPRFPLFAYFVIFHHKAPQRNADTAAVRLRGNKANDKQMDLFALSAAQLNRSTAGASLRSSAQFSEFVPLCLALANGEHLPLLFGGVNQNFPN